MLCDMEPLCLHSYSMHKFNQNSIDARQKREVHPTDMNMPVYHAPFAADHFLLIQPQKQAKLRAPSAMRVEAVSTWSWVTLPTDGDRVHMYISLTQFIYASGVVY